MAHEGEWYIDEGHTDWARLWDGDSYSGRERVRDLRAAGIVVRGYSGAPADLSAAGENTRRRARAADPGLARGRKRGQQGWLVLSGGLVTIGVVGAVAFSIGHAGGGSSVDAMPSASVEEFGSTGQTSYADVACADWADVSMDGNRYTMAADILTALREKEDGYTGVPDPSLVRE